SVPPAPDLAFVLEQRGAFNLSARQHQQLIRLEQRFGRETEEIRLALDQASAEFTRQMQEGGRKRALLPDLEQRTAAVSQLSRQLSAARHVYWAHAARMLTPAQRARVEALWVQQ